MMVFRRSKPGQEGYDVTAFCSEQAMYKQVYWQGLSYRKMGRKVIFLRQEVEAYLNGLPGLQLRHISL